MLVDINLNQDIHWIAAPDHIVAPTFFSDIGGKHEGAAVNLSELDNDCNN